MKRERVWVNDTSKLKGIGFNYYPASKFEAEHWRCCGIRVDGQGFVCVYSVKVAAIMKIVEMANLGLIEQRTQTKPPKIHVPMTDEEYEEFKKWKEGQSQ